MGSIGGMIMSYGVGDILQRKGSYLLVFLIAGTAYLVALCFVQILVPRLTRAELPCS
jgi:MFS transporter, ACS family, hexuronate transporter